HRTLNVIARRNDFDVVIVGGGMVGACVAALMARDERLAGWSIAVVEPAAPKAPLAGAVDLRVAALSTPRGPILRHAGAWPLIEPAGWPFSVMVVWDAAGRRDGRDVLRFSAAETGVPNLGHIAGNQRVQWALQQSTHVRGVTQLRAGL